MRQRTVIGLDIGRHSAKAVRMVRTGGGAAVTQSDWVRLPEVESERRRVLQSFIEQHGWSGCACVVPVRGEAAMVRALPVGGGGRRRLREVVGREVEQFTSLADGGTVSDAVEQPRFARRRSVLLAVGRLDGILRAVETYDALGLRVVDVVPGAVAMFNGIRWLDGVGRRPFVCVDLGHDDTDVCIGRRRQLFAVRRFPIGAAGFGGDEGVQKQELWIAELKACLDLYAAQFTHRKFTPRIVVLGGGGALTPELAERAEAALGLPVRPLNRSGRQVGVDEVERFVTAIGLGVSGLGVGRTAISLLPRAMRENLVLRWQKRYWVLSASALAAAIIALSAGRFMDLRRTERMIARRAAELTDLHDSRERLMGLEALNGRLERQTAPFRRAARNGVVLRAMIDAVGTAKHPDDWITLIADARSYARTEDETKRDAPEELSSPDQIIVEGYTPVQDLSTVRAMIDALQQHPEVAAADLLGDDRLRKDEERDARWSIAGGRLFAIEITLVSP